MKQSTDMAAEPPRISAIDRRLAWARLAGALFAEHDGSIEFDGYRLLGVLGRGATGTVYLAHDPTLEREVAIKLLEGGDRAATLHEARALARVAHPSVVAVHHVGDCDGLVYIVMERLRGHDLRSWQRGRAWPEVVRMSVELTLGLYVFANPVASCCVYFPRLPLIAVRPSPKRS